MTSQGASTSLTAPTGPTAPVGAPSGAPVLAAPPSNRRGALTLAELRAIRAARLASDAKKDDAFAYGLERISAKETASGGPHTTMSSASTMYICFVLPEKATDAQKRNWLYRLFSSLRSSSALRVGELISVVLSIFHVLYKSATELTSGTEWTRSVVTDQQITDMNNWMTETLTIPAKPPMGKDPVMTSWKDKTVIPGLPRVGVVGGSFFDGEQDFIQFHGAAGLVLYDMFKGSNSQASVSVTTTRPRALRDRFSRSEEQAPLWSTIGLPSEIVLKQLPSLPNLLTMTKLNWIERFASIAAQPSRAEEEALHLSIRMMAWGQLTHVALIAQALSSDDLIRKYAPLRGELAHFGSQMSKMFDLLPTQIDSNSRHMLDSRGEPVKNKTSLPYLKLMYGDKIDLATRKDLSLLTCIAVDYLRQTTPTLIAYVVPAGLDSRVADYRTWRAEVLNSLDDLE